MPKVGRFQVQVINEPEYPPYTIKFVENEVFLSKNDIAFTLIQKIDQQGGQSEVWISKINLEKSKNESNAKKLLEMNSNTKNSILLNDTNQINHFFIVKKMKIPYAKSKRYIEIYDQLYTRILKENNDLIEKTFEWYELETLGRDPTYIFISENIVGKHLTSDFIFNNNSLKNLTLLPKKFSGGVNIFLKIIELLLKGLDFLHRNNICHRDIKPENLMIYDTYENTGEYYNIKYKYQNERVLFGKKTKYNLTIDNIKYIDFGVSCLDTPKHNLCINDGMESVGTPGLIPPETTIEELTVKNPTIEDVKKGDIYSLGVTLFNLFHGFYFFDDEKADSMFPLDSYIKAYRYTMHCMNYKANKSYLHIYHNDDNLKVVDFIINLMIETNPQMRFDTKTLLSILNGKYKYFDRIPNNQIIRDVFNLKKSKLRKTKKLETKFYKTMLEESLYTQNRIQKKQTKATKLNPKKYSKGFKYTVGINNGRLKLINTKKKKTYSGVFNEENEHLYLKAFNNSNNNINQVSNNSLIDEEMDISMQINPTSMTHQLLYVETKGLKKNEIDIWKKECIERHKNSKELSENKYKNHFSR